MATLRLYYTDAGLLAFDATVVRVEPAGAAVRVLLTQSAFYPTSGGQACDTGQLGGGRVVDVTDDEETGEVWHVVEGGGFLEHAVVHGEVDAERRTDHRQQHTAQHVLSAGFESVLGVRTESVHLGRDVSTIDLARDVSRHEIERVEQWAHDVVCRAVPVRVRFVDEAEAQRLPLRKAPARRGRLRLIDIEDIDLSACGGTHVHSTGEIGPLFVTTWEKYKGGTRLSFVAGSRALRTARMWRETVHEATRILSVVSADIPDALTRLTTHLKQADKRASALHAELAIYQGAALAREAEIIGGRRCVCAAVDAPDASALKVLASAACAHGAGVAILVTTTSPASVACARSATDAFDCGAFVKEACAMFGGKGGGRPDAAQGGGITLNADQVLAFARDVLARHV